MAPHLSTGIPCFGLLGNHLWSNVATSRRPGPPSSIWGPMLCGNSTLHGHGGSPSTPSARKCSSRLTMRCSHALSSYHHRPTSPTRLLHI